MFSLLNVTIYVCVCFSDSPSFQNQIVAMYVYCLLLLIILVIYTSMAKVIVNKYTYIHYPKHRKRSRNLLDWLCNGFSQRMRWHGRDYPRLHQM